MKCLDCGAEMEQIFKKWYPYDNLDTMYDVDDIWMRPDGYTLILLPDGKYKEELEGQRLMLTWESIVSYQLSGKRYRSCKQRLRSLRVRDLQS